MDGNIEKITLVGQIDALPLVDDTLKRYGYAADAKVTGEALEERVRKLDVVDNLSSDATNKPLSANQGKVLKEQIEKIKLSEAGTVGYDNTDSGLDAVNAQSAIDEVARISKSALPKAGGNVSGAIKFYNNEEHGVVEKDNGMKLTDTVRDGRSASLIVNALLGLTFVDSDGNIRNIHHEGTKPFGSYEGVGNSSPRTIDTKGIGGLAMLYCDDYVSLVTLKGALVVELETASISWHQKATFSAGKLIMETSHKAFNDVDVVYFYQVI